MNIFVLDSNPQLAARMQCDKHVCKMAIEYAQLLSTAHHVHHTDVAQTQHIYKPTHVKHPSTLWVAAHPLHYAWLFELMRETWSEYTHRYQRIHASSRLLHALQIVPNMGHVGAPTAPPQCMPDVCKMPGATWEDTVAAYRRYYNIEKATFATWKSRETPEWFMPSKFVDIPSALSYNSSHEAQPSSLGR